MVGGASVTVRSTFMGGFSAIILSSTIRAVTTVPEVIRCALFKELVGTVVRSEGLFSGCTVTSLFRSYTNI